MIVRETEIIIEVKSNLHYLDSRGMGRMIRIMESQDNPKYEY